MPEPAAPAAALPVTAALALVALVAAALALVAGGMARRLFVAADGGRARPAPMARATVRLVRLVVFTLTALVLAFPALDFAGVHLGVGLDDEEVARWAARSGVRVAGLLLLAFGATRVVAALVARAEAEVLAGGPDEPERRRRTATLASVGRRFAAALIWTVSLLVMLRELDVDVTPILTGAGILGLAVGFGAQTLVKDIISGIFLIVEDQVRVGDVASVGGASGVVEALNLRTIVLRDVDGTVHVVPNGEIRMLANHGRDHAWAVLDLGVDHETDTDRAVEAVQAAAEELARDPVVGPSLLAPIEVMGVDAFAPSSVTVKFRLKTLPLKQWEVGRELRRRVKKALDERGIRLPVPRMDVRLQRGDRY